MKIRPIQTNRVADELARYSVIIYNISVFLKLTQPGWAMSLSLCFFGLHDLSLCSCVFCFTLVS